MTAKHPGKAAILFKQKAGRKFAKEKKKAAKPPGRANKMSRKKKFEM